MLIDIPADQLEKKFGGDCENLTTFFPPTNTIFEDLNEINKLFSDSSGNSAKKLHSMIGKEEFSSESNKSVEIHGNLNLISLNSSKSHEKFDYKLQNEDEIIESDKGKTKKKVKFKEIESRGILKNGKFQTKVDFEESCNNHSKVQFQNPENDESIEINNQMNSPIKFIKDEDDEKTFDLKKFDIEKKSNCLNNCIIF